jgi:hypothetical protein
MAGLHSRPVLWLAHAWQWVGAGGVALMLSVGVVWLAIFGAIVLVVPTPEQSVMPSPASYTVGRVAHIHGPPGTPVKIPLELGTFKDLYQALWDDNVFALNEVRSRPGWVQVLDGQTVQIVDVYDPGIQVELLNGPGTGVHAWVMLHQLRP